MASTSRTRIRRLRGPVISASNSGKWSTTGSSRPTSPSATAKPRAVLVNVLLSE